MIRTYTELQSYRTLEDRFEYLKIGARVGEETFGFDRWMNQRFYRSREWRQVRSFVITRDLGFDLGIDDFPIRGSVAIHHMNPIAVSDIRDSTDNLLNPEYLISASHATHNAIHYGDKELLPRPFVDRSPGDTRLW